MIRVEQPADYPAIAQVVAAAFGKPNEARLVELIRASPGYVPELALVDEDGGAITGHVMFSYATLRGEPDEWRVLVMAPVSVTPERQNQGIGSALVREGIARVTARNEPLISVLGHPAYYPRFGFEQARALGIEPPSPQIADAAFMMLRLPAYDERYRGQLIYPPAFDDT